MVKNTADESSTEGGDSGSEAKKNCAKEIEDPKDKNTDEYTPLGV